LYIEENEPHPHFTKTARQRAASNGRVIVSHDPFLSREAALSAMGYIPDSQHQSTRKSAKN
jgi:hypothetical protein